MNPETYILAVDDNAMNCDNLQEIIEDAELGYFIHCVNSGTVCLQSVQERIPDIILMGVKMPG